MERLQKKCFLGSLATHCGLVVAFVLGTAFMGDKTFKPLPMSERQPNITLVNIDALTDGDTKIGGHQGGAAPAPVPAPQVTAPPAQAERQPEPQPVQEAPAPVPAPQPIQAVHVVEPPKSDPRPSLRPDTKKKKTEVKRETPKTEPKKVEVNLARVDRSKTDDDRKRKAAVDAEKARKAADAKAIREQRARQTAINNAIGKTFDNLDQSLSTGGSVDVSSLGPTTGTGWGNGSGPTLVNFGQWVREVYDRNWLGTENIPNTEATAKVEVVINRNGSIAAARIVRKSGNTLLDNSVQATISRVKTINHPFPEGAKEATRTFNIEFNLASKRAAG